MMQLRLSSMALAILMSSAFLLLSSCGQAKEPAVPIGFEITSKTEINGYTVLTARDTGTGCEIIFSTAGIMPRNERSADGASVKQRCVLTGSETPMAPTTTMLPANPAQTSAMDSQAAAVAEAVRDATGTPGTGTIPPPAGNGTKPKDVPAQPKQTPTIPPPAEDGVESQLKN